MLDHFDYMYLNCKTASKHSNETLIFEKLSRSYKNNSYQIEKKS